MNAQDLLNTIRDSFLSMCEASEDSAASDQFIRNHHWARIEDGDFKLHKGRPTHPAPPTQIPNGLEEEPEMQFPGGIELDIYRFPIADHNELAMYIKEIAKTFHDLEGKSYRFEVCDSKATALTEWGPAFGPLANDQTIDPSHAFLVVKVYGDTRAALYLSISEQLLITYVFGTTIGVEEDNSFDE